MDLPFDNIISLFINYPYTPSVISLARFFGTPKFYIAPYDKINHALVNLSYNCDVKSGLRVKKGSLLVHLPSTFR